MYQYPFLNGILWQVGVVRGLTCGGATSSLVQYVKSLKFRGCDDDVCVSGFVVKSTVSKSLLVASLLLLRGVVGGGCPTDSFAHHFELLQGLSSHDWEQMSQRF